MAQKKHRITPLISLTLDKNNINFVDDEFHLYVEQAKPLNRSKRVDMIIKMAKDACLRQGKLHAD